MFRRKFWVALRLTVPTLVWGEKVPHALGFTPPAVPGARWTPAALPRLSPTTSFDWVSARLDVVNGPRGGRLRRIKLVPSGVPRAVFPSRAASLDYFKGALTGEERAVRRSVQRRRPKSIKTVARGESGPGGQRGVPACPSDGT
jgi:hypothetical protein